NPCPSCSGSGRVTRERALSVNTPAGVEDGTRIRLAGEGEAGGRGGPAGDLYIFLALGAHPFFQREGADLHCRVPISMVLAALGGEIEGPTIDGNQRRVRVPGGAQTGAALPPSKQGHAGAALQTNRRYVHSSPGRDAAKTQPATARIAGRIRTIVVPGHAAGSGGILRQGQGVLGSFRLGLSKLPLDPLPVGGSNRQIFRSVSPNMPLPALQLLEQKLEKQKRLFELRKGALERTNKQHIQLFEQRKGALERKLERQFETHKKKFEQKFDTQKKKIETRIRRFEQKNGIRLDDEVRFIRSWIEKPLTTGAVTPSG